MQDRFKLRYNNNNKIYDVSAIDFTRSRGEIVSLDKKETLMCKINLDNLMQATGLKDKNGKLIYEGDIVKIEYYDFETKHRIGIVEWEDDGFCITYHNAKDTKVSGCSLVDIVNGDKQEVIGNIYENPELLEKELNNANISNE